jgi:hypothetical protein
LSSLAVEACQEQEHEEQQTKSRQEQAQQAQEQAHNKQQTKSRHTTSSRLGAGISSMSWSEQLGG